MNFQAMYLEMLHYAPPTSRSRVAMLIGWSRNLDLDVPSTEVNELRQHPLGQNHEDETILQLTSTVYREHNSRSLWTCCIIWGSWMARTSRTTYI